MSFEDFMFRISSYGSGHSLRHSFGPWKKKVSNSVLHENHADCGIVTRLPENCSFFEIVLPKRKNPFIWIKKEF